MTTVLADLLRNLRPSEDFLDNILEGRLLNIILKAIEETGHILSSILLHRDIQRVFPVEFLKREAEFVRIVGLTVGKL